MEVVNTNKKAKDVSFIDTFSSEVLSWADKTSKYMDDAVYPEWALGYEEVQLYMGRRKAKLAEQGQLWRHNEKYPLTLEQFRRNSGIYRKIDYTKVNVEPLFPKYAEHADVYGSLMRHIFNRGDNKQQIQQVVDEALLNGNGYAFLSRGEKEYKIPKNISKGIEGINVSYDIEKEMGVDINYISAFDVLLDLQSQSNMYRQRGYRKFMSLAQVMKEYGDLLNKEKIDKIKQGKNFIMNDWNKIKSISMYSSEFNKKCVTIANSVIQRGEMKYGMIDDNAYFSIKGNNLHEVVTVYAEGIEGLKSDWYEVVIVSGVVIYAGKSMLPFDGSPICDLQFFKLPGSPIASGIAQLVRPHQRQADTVSNLGVDNLVMALAPMFEIDKQIGKNNKTFTMYPGKMVERSMTGQGIDKINIGDASLSQWSIQATQQIQNYADRGLGLTGGGKVERVKDGVLERKAEADNKNAMFIDNLNAFVSEVGTKAALLTKVHAPKKYMLSLLEGGTNVYEEIETRDIYNTFKITIDTSGLSNSKVEQNTNDIALVNGIAPLLTDQSTGTTRIDIDGFIKKILERQNLGDLYMDTDKRKEKLSDDVELVNYIKGLNQQGGGEPQKVDNTAQTKQTAQDVVPQEEKTYQELYA